MRSKYGKIPEGAEHIEGYLCANCERVACKVSESKILSLKPCKHSRIVEDDDSEYTLIGTVAKWANIYQRETGRCFADWVSEIFCEEQSYDFPYLFCRLYSRREKSIENCNNCEYLKTCKDAIREESS